MRFLSLALASLLPFMTACDLLSSGEECSADSDCSGDDICDGGECVECENDRDCDDDEECDDGECESIGEGEGEEGEGEGEGGEGEGEATGEPCNPDTFAANCSGDIIQLCGPESEGGPDVIAELNCSSEFYLDGDGNPSVDPTITCVEPSALGSVPPPLRAQCWGEGNGASCQGAIGLMTAGAEALLIGCAAGFSCTLGETGDACAPSPSTCSETGASCNGSELVLCAFGGDGFTFADPIVVDCASIGGNCQSDGTNAACVSDIGGLCAINNFIAQCGSGTCTPDAAAPGLGNCN